MVEPSEGAADHSPDGLPRVEEEQSAPALLYVSEFPPCDVTAGNILIARLLKGYPAERLRVLAGSHFMKRFRDGQLDCAHIRFPQTSNVGRWGLGRLKQLLEIGLLPLLAVYCRRVIRRHGVEVVLSLGHNLYFVAAAAAARLSHVPFVLVVHDDWLHFMQWNMWVPNRAARWCYQRVLRSATHIYAVSPAMQEALREEYGVESEVQLPASEAQPGNEDPAGAPGRLQVVFAGTTTAATSASIDLLVKALRSPNLSEVAWKLDLYGASPEMLREFGWEDERIHAHGWAPQPELLAALRAADVLYLPYSFDASQARFVQTSFPSKLADYLASGKPVLLCAPPDAAVVPYARDGGFAEVVDCPSEELIAAALGRLASSPEHRACLAAQGTQVFAKNHDIVRQRLEFIARLTRLVDQGTVREASARPNGS
jgi:glycosyltransferase involved in cell wall biosynthesis